MPDATSPFVLFDDARVEGERRARLYRDPSNIVETSRPEEVRACLEWLRKAQQDGLHAAGMLAYGAGQALDSKLAPLRRPAGEDAPPLLWFGLFEGYDEVSVEELLPGPEGAWTSEPRALVERADYEAAVARVKAHIDAGDIYQVNLTFQAEVRTCGHPLAIYSALRGRALAGHGGLLFTGTHWLLSFSPELFFTLDARRITARPMKGTARREADRAADAAAARALSDDPKQRAENLMIVDLLRNDLSRVSKPGTVEVPSLFAIESYPTVHQMTSTVTAELEDAVTGVDVIEAIFPCGSITGAPKLRAMEIIDQLETAPRNAYTGSIGWFAPGGDASLNVAIRTLTIKAGETRAWMGLGSGIVADSRASDEWRECLAKGAFVKTARSFDLIETMRFDPHDGIAELERHLARMKSSAEALGFPFDRHCARNDLQAGTFRQREACMVRLLLSAKGSVAIETKRLPPAPAEPVEVAVGPLPVRSDDFRLAHKTSDRAFYDEARVASGKFEILFKDEQGFLTQGSFTNLFVERDGRLLTPPLSRGLLAGVLRGKLIEEGQAEEADLQVSDLRQGFLIGNAVRGLIRARIRN